MPNYGPNNENLPEPLQDCLAEIIRQMEKEDDNVRKQQIRQWKKNDRFWHGIQYIFWSETQQDWIAPINTRWDDLTANREEADGPFYDYVVNIYKAHGESIIAALSAQVPAVRFPPDDANNEDDLQTAKTYDKVADLIQRHNQSKMIILQALLALWNQGLVFAYHAPKSDKTFGNLQIPEYDTAQECQNCGWTDSDEQSQSSYANSIKNGPNTGEEVHAQEIGSQSTQTDEAQAQGTCPQCGGPLMPIPVLTGFSDAPKTRVLIDIYNPLFVKVPYYARTQNECGYLGLSIDQPISLLKHLFDHIADKIEAESNLYDVYEKLGRAPSSYSYAIIDNKNLRTLRRWWIRPYEFQRLGSEKESEIKQLYKIFPDGAYVCFVGDCYAESRNELLDKYWTIGKAGLSTYIHSDPMGQPLINEQEKVNVLDNLTLETIEQGISTVFADPEVLNFEDFSRHELRPGMFVPAKAKTGKTLAEGFYEGPKATLSKEVPLYREQIDKDAQFLVGSFPSIYGGPGEGSSRTAAEYDMSRQMALQRLSITWTMFAHWWARLMEKCVRIYVENLIGDEHYVSMNKNNYVNVWIRQSELSGKVGEVEAEAAETFPVTLGQKQSLLFKLMSMNSDLINAALFSVENRKIISEILSFPELTIPDEAQRIKQMRETQTMVEKLEPVQIEPLVDDNDVHIEVLRDYMASDYGADIKSNNPQAYQLLMDHLQMHMQSQIQDLAPANLSSPAAPAPATSVAKAAVGGPPPESGVQ
jgi:DNA-directed RNA polymerase subunit M/transcription elongation factor TFIIS